MKTVFDLSIHNPSKGDIDGFVPCHPFRIKKEDAVDGSLKNFMQSEFSEGFSSGDLKLIRDRLLSCGFKETDNIELRLEFEPIEVKGIVFQLWGCSGDWQIKEAEILEGYAKADDGLIVDQLIETKVKVSVDGQN